MIVSALLTSVGINTALCVLFFILYSVLRKQPSNYEVYVPRLLAEGTSRRRSHFNLERLIPSAGWVAKAWRLSEDEILSLFGLDGVVFMRLITFRYLSLFITSFYLQIQDCCLEPVNTKILGEPSFLLFFSNCCCQCSGMHRILQPGHIYYLFIHCQTVHISIENNFPENE